MDTWWHTVWMTLQAEFADIGDIREVTRITVRLLIAALLGGWVASSALSANNRARLRACAPICWSPWGRRCSCG